jgi:hypothetical protein
MFTWFTRLVARLVPATLEGRAAAITVLLLAITIAVALTFMLMTDVRLPGAGSWIIIGVLFVLLPIIVFVGIRYWNRTEASLYPDIDEAWRGGIDALQRAGISLDSAPLFLVLGGSEIDDAFAKALQSAGTAFRVERAPATAGIDPVLRWYANESAIYLFCSGVGALSSLVRQWAQATHGLPANWADPSPTRPTPIGRSPSASLQHAALRTITPWDVPTEEPTPAETVWQAPATQRSRSAQLPTDIDVEQQERRLRYLCRLIKSTRRPRCGINGAVAVLPYALVGAEGRELEAVIECVDRDTKTVHQTLWLRYPVSGLVVGMEHAEGFDEFVRLLGAKHVTRRLGARYDLRRRATVERLQQLSDRICDAFEDFVYVLFDRPDALWQVRDNRKLFGLLCRVREQLKPKLNAILGSAFGREGQGERPSAWSDRRGQPPVFFSGCYLAATGSGPEQQAFINGVLNEKLIREQSRVEWTEDARASQTRFRLAVWAGWLVLGGMLVVMALQPFGELFRVR